MQNIDNKQKPHIKAKETNEHKKKQQQEIITKTKKRQTKQIIKYKQKETYKQTVNNQAPAKTQQQQIKHRSNQQHSSKQEIQIKKTKRK